MATRRAYCSACDRNVPVIVPLQADRSTEPSLHDAEALVCLDYGVRCTGWMCPLFSVPELPADDRPGADGPGRT